MENTFYKPNASIQTKLVNLSKSIKEQFADAVISTVFCYGELTIIIKKDSLLKIIGYLRDDSNLLFKQLSDITAIDYPDKTNRFVVVYQLLSLNLNLRIRVKIEVPENYIVPSVYKYYNNADWLECEVFDMFGIYFSNHPDLRRILTDFGFEGYPLRKDFPLSGYNEVYFDEKEQQVKYKPVELDQEYRDFKSINPWLDIGKNREN